MKTAKQLIDELTSAGLSQGKVSEATGIPQATISRIQNGKIADTKASYWNRLSAFHAQHFAARSNSLTQAAAA
ncbi:helix-turn-helix transcriptional regulator [Paraburkholderia sp. Ac-20340]|uniref:helix-turn-helix domain-containing protein n=1 Tax=Paraburkholderia sp. Ac-20340 TaxID=2703888 RepID=UPI00198000C7|nr:helix-turn-helix transcriptional regulator [Paraburkholderia sp. Ac-20340]MBN3853811.1 helix-turn-helix transcriptional regulator [Paraburkholderia sp. Ac-20340]